MGRLAMAGRMGNNRPRGSVNYTVGGSALNAAPYSLTGRPIEESQYLQQRIAANVGGPLANQNYLVIRSGDAPVLPPAIAQTFTCPGSTVAHQPST